MRPVASKFYAFLNDQNRHRTTSIVEGLRNYDIVPVIWSRRDEVIRIGGLSFSSETSAR